jgi:hypothetical protein
MTVQIDIAIWAILALAIIGLLVCFTLKRRQTLQWVNDRLLRPVPVFLIATLLIFLLLQFKITKPLYEQLSVMQFLQFPWRLLAYITPLGILLVIRLATELRPRRYVLWAAMAVWLIVFVALSPLPHNYQYPFLSPQAISVHASAAHPEFSGSDLAGIGEYYPRVYDAGGRELSTLATVQVYQQLYSQKRTLQVLGGICDIAQLPQHSLEVQTLYFRYTCDSASLVALPVSYTRLTYVTNDFTGQRVMRFRQAGDPRMLVNLKPGSGELTVHLPSVATALQMAIRH